MLETMSLEEIGRHEPAVVFIDIDFIDADPIDALRRLRALVPNATLCAYTGNGESGWAAACSRAGANCVISKSATPIEIVDGINLALRVGAFVDHRFDEQANLP